MSESIVVSLIVSLVSLAAHVAVGAYWAGRIVGRLALIEHRLDELEGRVGRLEGAPEDHPRERRRKAWGEA